MKASEVKKSWEEEAMAQQGAEVAKDWRLTAVRGCTTMQGTKSKATNREMNLHKNMGRMMKDFTEFELRGEWIERLKRKTGGPKRSMSPGEASIYKDAFTTLRRCG